MTQIADALWTNYSPSYSTKNNCSSHCSTADQEPSAHHPLSSLWRKGHCTPSRLQTYFSDGAILPWPQGVPDPTAATTLKTKTDKLKLEKEGKTSLYYYSHSISLWCGVPSRPHLHCYSPGKSSLIWTSASTLQLVSLFQSILALHEPFGLCILSPDLTLHLNMDYFLSPMGL